MCAGEGEGSYFHSSKLVTTAACNVQTIGRDVLYTPRIETRLKTGAHGQPPAICGGSRDVFFSTFLKPS